MGEYICRGNLCIFSSVDIAESSCVGWHTQYLKQSLYVFMLLVTSEELIETLKKRPVRAPGL